MTLFNKYPLSAFYIFALIAFVLFNSCSKDPDPSADEKKKTLLFYMVADNDLDSYMNNNIIDIVAGVAKYDMSQVNLLIYFDSRSTPVLMQVDNSGKRVIKNYSEHNSLQKDIMRGIIDDVCSRFPAKSYGLVFSSHATAWLPDGSPLITRSRTMSAQFPITKTFGNDQGELMDIADLAQALPDARFEYILFDACYMGNIETAYALRKKAQYYIGSPTEVIGTGFPYSTIMPDMLAEKAKVVDFSRKYYEYYNTHPNGGDWRSASICVLKCSELDQLAIDTRAVIQANMTKIPNFNLGSIQHYDMFRKNWQFDLDQFISSIGAGSPVQLAAFKEQLAKSVIYKASTPKFFDLPIDLTKFSGAGCYIPVSIYNSYNPPYYELSWYKDLYLN